jgi:hypothetical protein
MCFIPDPTSILLVILHINDRLLPLSCRDFTLEHNVNFTVGSAPHLGQPKVCHEEANQSSATPDVSTLASEVSALQYVSNCKRKDLKEKSRTVGLSRKLDRKMRGISTM